MLPLQGRREAPRGHRSRLMRELQVETAPPLNRQAGDLTGSEIANSLGLPAQAVRLLPYHVTPLIRFSGGYCHQYYRPEMFNSGIVANIRAVLRIVSGHLQSGDKWHFEELAGIVKRVGEFIPCSVVQFRPGRWDVTLLPCGTVVRASSKYFRLITVRDEVIDIRPYLVGMVEHYE